MFCSKIIEAKEASRHPGASSIISIEKKWRSKSLGSRSTTCWFFAQASGQWLFLRKDNAMIQTIVFCCCIYSKFEAFVHVFPWRCCSLAENMHNSRDPLIVLKHGEMTFILSIAADISIIADTHRFIGFHRPLARRHSKDIMIYCVTIKGCFL